MAARMKGGGHRRFAHSLVADECHRLAVQTHGAGVQDKEFPLMKQQGEHGTEQVEANQSRLGIPAARHMEISRPAALMRKEATPG